MSAQELVDSLLQNLPADSRPPKVIVAVDSGPTIEFSDDKNLIFDLGSLTKILSTTSMVMKLIEFGELKLEDPILRYLPGKSFEGITIRELLCHRSGLWEWRPFYIELEDEEELISHIGELPLRYPINSERHYSDLGFIVLGKVIEKICQDSLEPIFQEYIANPLKLRDSQYGNPVKLENCVASSHGDRAEYKMLTDNSPYPVNVNPADFTHWRDYLLQGEVNDGNAFHVMNSASGHAGLFASIADVMTYGREVLDSLKGEGFFDETVVRDFFNFTVDQEQALGFQRYQIETGSTAVTALGHTGFPGVALAILPEADQVVGLFSNRLLVSGEPFQTKTALINILQNLSL